jgi:hypothetical protein
VAGEQAGLQVRDQADGHLLAEERVDDLLGLAGGVGAIRVSTDRGYPAVGVSSRPQFS